MRMLTAIAVNHDRQFSQRIEIDILEAVSSARRTKIASSHCWMKSKTSAIASIVVRGVRTRVLVGLNKRLPHLPASIPLKSGNSGGHIVFLPVLWHESMG